MQTENSCLPKIQEICIYLTVYTKYRVARRHKHSA